MANVKLGEKHECHDCGAKFYDFGKDPVICPKCGTDQRTGEPEPEPEPEEVLVEDDGADVPTEPDEVAVVGDEDVDDDDDEDVDDDDLDDLPDLDDEDFGDDDEDDGDDDFEDD